MIHALPARPLLQEILRQVLSHAQRTSYHLALPSNESHRFVRPFMISWQGDSNTQTSARMWHRSFTPVPHQQPYPQKCLLTMLKK